MSLDGFYTLFYIYYILLFIHTKVYIALQPSIPLHRSEVKIMDFNKCESQAFNGEYLPYDDMPPAEYKYFTRIAELGRGVRAGKYTSTQAASLRSEYLAEYQRTHERYTWPEIIKLTEDLRVHINGSHDPAFIAALALRALWMITGDTMLETKMEEMEAAYAIEK